MKKFIKYISFTIVLLIYSISINAQTIERVEPPFWWAEMHNTKLQLMVYGENISELSPNIDDDSVVIIKVHKAKSPNYLFIDLDISKANSGTFDIEFLKVAQVIQNTLSDIQINLVVESEFNKDNEQIISKRLKSQLGEIVISYNYLDEIPKGKNGKFKAVISNLKNQEK